MAQEQDDNPVTFRQPASTTLQDDPNRPGRSLMGLFQEQTAAQKAASEPLNGLDLIVQSFPLLQDALIICQKRCDCSTCPDGGAIGLGKPSCLRETAINILFTLLGHGIAEGFGVSDISGIIPAIVHRSAVSGILMHVVRFKRIIWDSWFSLAASIFLGCQSSDARLSRSQGAGELVAVQHGSMVVVARWACLGNQLQKTDIFSLFQAEGHLRGLQDEYALVQVEKTTDLDDCNLGDQTPWITRRNQGLQTEAFQEDYSKDLSTPSLTHWMINDEGPCSHLLIVIQTSSFDRIINPARAIMSLFRSVYVSCKHNDKQHTVMVVKTTASMWNLESALSKWNSWNNHVQPTQPIQSAMHPERKSQATDEGREGIPTLYVSHTLDTELKMNVAFALSPFGLVVKHPTRSCLKCAVEAVSNIDTHGNAWRIVNKDIFEGQLVIRSSDDR
ncbi:hypothetical protein EV356DRAFT_571795 [Viridothelium virens]|uniref:Uncharacterized protein n=1 Tax=Viridothelium virens TaxID=1048519 RepID=A0A6A6GSS3_VIRVR|nr:hypothetical protein EV356DRAFT_571795 [Viridothelium virens]